jgi:hypothetical protein
VRPGFKSIRAESLILLQLCSKDHETFQARQCLCDLDVYLPLVLVPRRATNYFAEEQNVPALYSDNRAMSQPFTRDQLDAFAGEGMEYARNFSAFSAAGYDFNRSEIG